MLGEWGWMAPLGAAEMGTVVDICRANGGVVLVGQRGTGRDIVAREILRQMKPGVTVRHGLAHRSDRSVPFAVLQALGFEPEGDSGISPAFVASRIRQELGDQPLALIIEDLEFADPASVRVVAALARGGDVVVVAIVGSPGSSAAGTLGFPDYTIPDLTLDVLKTAIAGRLGAGLIDRDIQWVESVCDRKYDSVRWLVETCLSSGAINVAHGVARIQVPRGAVPPVWELEPSLTDTQLGRLMAILVEAPLSLLRRLVGSEAIAAAEEAGTILIEDDGRWVRLVNRTAGLDLLFRMATERKRVVVETILSEGLSVSEFSERGAASLVILAIDLGIQVPQDLAQFAVPQIMRMGYPDIAGRLSSDAPDIVAELVLSDILMGGIDDAVSRFGRAFPSASYAHGSAFEASVLALMLGELRHGETASLTTAIDSAIGWADSSEVKLMLVAYRALIRPRAEAPDWAELELVHGGTPTAARIQCALAYWNLMDGRPEQAMRLLPDGVMASGFTIDRHLSVLLSFLLGLAAPNLIAARQALPPRAPHFPSRTNEGILWAMLAIYEGDPATALHTLESELELLSAAFPSIISIAYGAAALCASFLGERRLAKSYLAVAQQPSPAPVLEAARLFVVATASPSLRGGGVEKASILLTQTSAAATAAHLRALTVQAALGQILLFRIAHSKLSSPMLPTVQAERPYDGVFRRYFDLALAHQCDDFPRAAAIALELHNLGLRIDAMGVAVSILGSETAPPLPRTLERAVARLARERPGPGTNRIINELLTRRELEVAQLVAERLTDRQIAQRLHLSVRTVSVHVGRILKKLGVSTRHHVASALNREPEA